MRTKKLLSDLTLFAVLASFLFTLTTCKKKEEDPPPSNEEFVIAPTAKFIVDNDWQSMVESVDSTNYTLTFNKDVISRYSLVQGSLIVSSAGNGLLRKIESITQSGNNVTIQTSQATLADLIQQGTIDYKGSLSLSKVKSITYYYPGISLDTVSIKTTDGTLFNWNINTDIAPMIKLQGSLQYTSDFILQIDITIFEGLKKVKFGFEGNEEFNLALIAGQQFTLTKEITLFTVHFAPFVIPMGIPPFAIIVAPVLDIKLGLNGYANGNITTTLSQKFTTGTGIQYLQSSGWSSYLDTVKSFTYTPPQLNMNAGAEAYIKPELTMLIYNLVGPYVNGKGYGRIAADLTQTPWWRMYYGFNMGIGVKAEILEEELFDYSKDDLLAWEQQVGQSAGTPPAVSTASITNITDTTATCGGNITDQGSSPVTARGVCWSASPNPTISGAHTTDGSGTGSFTSNITGLSPNTPYYVKAYATNSAGTSYGSQVSFTTTGTGTIPTVSTNSITNVTETTATGGGNVTTQGSSSVTARGVCWSTSQNPTTSDSHTTDGSGTGSFTSNITGLTANTPYYVRAYATNSAGTSYGSQVNFTTTGSGTAPTVTTASITNITETTATGGGDVTVEGSSPVTARGVCWSTSSDPAISDNHTADGSGTGSFTSNITGLTANTPYFVRAYATNSEGTSYGSQQSFTTTGGSAGEPCPGMPTITDSRDGQVYPTVQIGSQCWLQKNMNYSTVTSWCYENNSSNCDTYGRLYDWQSALGACPSGWHLPSDAELTVLTDFLGGESVAGGKMKETGTTHWFSPNVGATNSSGFTALPGGGWLDNGKFYDLHVGAYFWTSTEDWSGVEAFAFFRTLHNNYELVGRYLTYKTFSYSVRCVKD
jgi:uncharacterized protein (TIGR02145 family)